MDEEIAAARSPAHVGVMLAALTMIFALSHAFRITIAIASEPFTVELGASAQALAAVAGSLVFQRAAESRPNSSYSRSRRRRLESRRDCSIISRWL